MASHCTYGPEGRHGPTTRVLIYIRASHYAWAPWPDWNIRAVGSVQSNLSFRSVRKSSDSDSHLLHACLPVCPFVYSSVRMEQLGSHSTDFHEIWYFSKIYQEYSTLLKSDNTNWCCTSGMSNMRPADRMRPFASTPAARTKDTVIWSFNGQNCSF